MRYLFTFAGGRGHFIPTLPVARALAGRGHDVVYACQEAMVDTVAAEGLAAVASAGATLAKPSDRRPLVPVDRLAEERVIRNVFAGQIARERTGQLLGVAATWRPDVIVRDEMDFGAAVAAEALGVPHAAVIVIAAGGLVRPDLVGQPLSALRVEHGLGADPELEMLHRFLTIVPVPVSYRDPRDPLPATAHHVRPAVLDARDVDRPEVGTRRPTVYFTLGTIFHQESGDLFTRVLAGVCHLPVDVLVTVGTEIDPKELGDQPPNVRVERFVPEARVLPHCDALVSHAGSGTVISALAFGLPSVLLPMGADQPLNADRCSELGVATVLDVSTCTSDDIGRAVATVMSDPSYRAKATQLRDEIAALPGAQHAASLLERLGASRAAILSD
jgi:UDP:flavonoid glycosyltransferase YjiC (YdhE family)